MTNILKQKKKSKRYKRAHNMLKNNISRDSRGFYVASRKLGLNRKRYDKGGDKK